MVIEKPFGHDLESARELNRQVNAVFLEDQVFRIDHYLGKETVQNLLVLSLIHIYGQRGLALRGGREVAGGRRNSRAGSQLSELETLRGTIGGI